MMLMRVFVSSTKSAPETIYCQNELLTFRAIHLLQLLKEDLDFLAVWSRHGNQMKTLEPRISLCPQICPGIFSPWHS